MAQVVLPNRPPQLLVVSKEKRLLKTGSRKDSLARGTESGRLGEEGELSLWKEKKSDVLWV